MKTRFAKFALITLLAGTVPLSGVYAEEDVNNRIIDEGMNRSELPQRAHELLDGIGPRLTNSTGMRQAEQWAVETMAALGLTQVHKEGYEFGRGWDLIGSSAQLANGNHDLLNVIPIAWTPGTDGILEAEIVVAPMSEPDHFAAYRGKLRGKIVFVSIPGTGDEPTTPAFKRLEASDIRDLDKFDYPSFDPRAKNFRAERIAYPHKLDAFLREEGALAWVRMSRRDGQLLHGEGYTFESGKTPVLPGFEMAAEDYRKLSRMAKGDVAPRLALSSQVRFLDDDSKAYNIIGEIPGSDPRAGYVMAGAHLDSWVAADGAVDNGAGSITVLEAARILKKLGVKPKRTIRFALWSGEEQGLHGSLAYIRQHLATRAGDGKTLADSFNWGTLFPITPKPGHGQLKAYFNMDNGSGKIRGIYGENNVAATPLLRKWLAPFSGLGAGDVVISPTTGTDHVFMQSVGVPGFQFIQDPLDYFARLHHTSIDSFDHLKMDDLRQASVVMAGVLLAAANDDDTLPREVVPQQPVETEPFKYDYPQDN